MMVVIHIRHLEKVWSCHVYIGRYQMVTNMVQALGATAVTIPYAEMYSSFSTGVIEGNIGTIAGVWMNKLYEVLDYKCMWPFITYSETICMNKQSFESLPPDIKDIVEELVNQIPKMNLEKDVIYNNLTAESIIVEKGVEIVPIAPEEVVKAKEIAETEVWPTLLEGAGPDAQALLDIYLRYAAQ